MGQQVPVTLVQCIESCESSHCGHAVSRALTANIRSLVQSWAVPNLQISPKTPGSVSHCHIVNNLFLSSFSATYIFKLSSQYLDPMSQVGNIMTSCTQASNTVDSDYTIYCIASLALKGLFIIQLVFNF